MKRVLLFCAGIPLGLVAVSFLGGGASELPWDKTWFSGNYDRIIGLNLIVQGAVVTLGAALCVGRAIIPLKSVPAGSRTAVSGPESAITGGGPVLPICAIPFLFVAVPVFMAAPSAAEQLERMDRASRELEPMHRDFSQDRADLVEFYRRQERTMYTFGVLSLAFGGMLLVTPLFLKRRVWQLGRPINGAGVGIAIGGLLLFGMALFVWRASLTILHRDWEFYCPAGVLGVLAGTLVTVFGGIKAVAGGRPSD